MTAMLVSVRNLAEARIAAACGIDFLDLKDPAAGALGGLPPALIAAIVAAVRAANPALRISATIGDLPAHEPAAIEAAIAAVAACGVDFVKVGVPGQGGAVARALLQRLDASAHAVVPVLIADDGVNEALLRAACACTFPALMLDTQDKRGGSLFDRVGEPALRSLAAIARAAAMPLGFAGALRADEVPRLHALQVAFAGFRSAVCEASRSSALDEAKLRALRAALRAAATTAKGKDPEAGAAQRAARTLLPS